MYSVAGITYQQGWIQMISDLSEGRKLLLQLYCTVGFQSFFLLATGVPLELTKVGVILCKVYYVILSSVLMVNT